MKRNVLAKTLLIAVSAGFISLTTLGQQSQVLLTVGNDNITKQEFENIYKKNNVKQTAPADEKTMREYLDLYINFRLKVNEAEALGLDTTSSFKTELAGYRRQLAQPYLTDKEVTEKLIQEAYERSQKEIRASHILINSAPDALPKDTLAAYNKALDLRRRIVEKGEDFGKLAEAHSEDPSAKQNKGDLGYFSAFTMVYPFETMAYKTKPGTVSMPVRTRFGYHLIKVTDSRAAQGEIKAAHIMIRTPQGSTADDSAKAKAKIDEIYAKLKAGESFEDLVKQYSEDKNSVKANGVLPAFGTGKMVIEFETAAFNLKNNGDISEPVKTAYGWHIIKRIDRKAPPTFEEAKNDLKNKVSRDSRSELNKQSFVRKLKKEYNFTENLKARDEFYAVMDSAIYKGDWYIRKAHGMEKPLFTLDGKTYTQKDFAKFISENQGYAGKLSFQGVVNNLYTMFTEKTIMDYEESRLEQKYPEFKSLMQEYRDGILLFELTDDMVWTKAVKDSAGLQDFFIKNNEKYKWNERLDAVIYTTSSEEVAAKVRKLLKNKKITRDSLLTVINKDNPLNLVIKEDKFEKGENAIIDGIVWEKGMTDNFMNANAVVFVDVKRSLPPQLKTLNEVRGAVTADYQNYLEKEWITALRAKYPVTVNESVFKTLIQ